MSIVTFFTRQARQPSGWFGRWIMSAIFDVGNAPLNRLVFENLSPERGDHILEIGCGTGKLLQRITGSCAECIVEGVDFSGTMVAMARKNNRERIDSGRVILHRGDIDELSFPAGRFIKACSVNTLYFWADPGSTLGTVHRLLKPGGRLLLGYEDRKQLEQRQLDREVFRIYSRYEVETLLTATGFENDVQTRSMKKGASWFHCTCGTK